jgi:hypothetical protein
MTVAPLTSEVAVGNTITWISRTTIFVPPASEIEVTVPAGPFGGAFQRRVAIFTDIVSPAVVAGAAGTTTAYTVRIFNVNGALIREETRLFVWVPGARDGTQRVRGLFVSGPPDPHFDNNVDHLRDVIHDGTTAFGTNWAARPTVQRDRTQAQLVADIAASSAGADDDDVFVFLFSGHGTKARNGDEPQQDMRIIRYLGSDHLVCDTPECDEGISVQVDVSILDDILGNGAIGQALANVRGIKVLIFQSCFSGGIMDRRLTRASLDLPIANSITMSSCSTNQLSSASPARVFGHGHSYFAGSLISGLLNVDPVGDAGPPPAGVVAAEPRPNAPGQVTVRNWFDFAAGQVAQIVASPKVVPEAQSPQLDDSFAAPGHKAQNIIAFRYNQGTISAHAHVDPPGDTPEPPIPECGCDFGDAPDPFKGIPGQYPTRKASIGACHAIFTLEWLGLAVDGEEPEADPERDGIDFDEDGNEGDEFDDGVRIIELPGGALEIQVTASVADKEFVNSDGLPRYESSDPSRRLYLNAWADWNGDGIWNSDGCPEIAPRTFDCSGGQEKVIGFTPEQFAIDPRTDPEFSGDNSGTYFFTIIPPLFIAEDFYWRFRLDYGEDVGEVQQVDPTLDQERGRAQFGEVEDYPHKFFLLKADRLHSIGPIPNRVPAGATGTIAATVQYNLSSAPDVAVVFTKLGGDFSFTSGSISADGKRATATTDADGVATMTIVPNAAGAALVRVAVPGTSLSAFALFFGISQ